LNGCALRRRETPQTGRHLTARFRRLSVICAAKLDDAEVRQRTAATSRIASRHRSAAARSSTHASAGAASMATLAALGS